MKKYPLSVRILLYFQKKRYGAPLGPTLAWGLRPNLLFAFLKFGKAFEKNSALSSHLRTLVILKISELILEKLKSHFSEAAIVELTALIGFEYLSTLFNKALRIPAQGICKIKN